MEGELSSKHQALMDAQKESDRMGKELLGREAEARRAREWELRCEAAEQDASSLRQEAALLSRRFQV